MIADALYRDVILDHHRHPRGREPVGRIDAHAHGKNVTCGDDVAVRLQLDGGRISGVTVDGRGCSISTASGSILAELLDGLTMAEARELAGRFGEMLRQGASDEDLGDLEALAGVGKFPMRVKCALLPWTTLIEALDRYEE